MEDINQKFTRHFPSRKAACFTRVRASEAARCINYVAYTLQIHAEAVLMEVHRRKSNSRNLGSWNTDYETECLLLE